MTALKANNVTLLLYLDDISPSVSNDPSFDTIFDAARLEKSKQPNIEACLSYLMLDTIIITIIELRRHVMHSSHIFFLHVVLLFKFARYLQS